MSKEHSTSASASTIEVHRPRTKKANEEHSENEVSSAIQPSTCTSFTELGLLPDNMSSASSSSGSSSDSYMTDDSSTVPSKYNSSYYDGDKSVDQSTDGYDSGDFATRMDSIDQIGTLGPLPRFPPNLKVNTSGSDSLDTQKLVQTASNIAPNAFQASLHDLRGIMSDSSDSSSPWVDSSDSSSFDTSTESDLERRIKGTKRWAQKIVAVAAEGSHKSSPIDLTVIDIESGRPRTESTHDGRSSTGFSDGSVGIEIASNSNEVSTVHPMDRRVARDAFVTKRDSRRNFFTRPLMLEKLSRPRKSRNNQRDPDAEIPPPTPPIPVNFQSSERQLKSNWVSWRERTMCELFFLVMIGVSLVSLVVLLSIILTK